MRNYHYAILVFVFNFFSITLTAQLESFRFTHFDIENGLADNYVSAMHMDKLGFLWIGTHQGLSRYDGYSFKNFLHVDGDTTCLSGNTIKSIKEDSQGNLWIGTIGGSLNQFDPTTETFRSFKYIIENPYTEGYNVTSLIFDESENIWMGTFGCGLQFFNKSTKKFERFNLNENLKTGTEAFNKNTVYSLVEDINNSNLIWVGTSQGLYLFDKMSKKMKKIPLVINGTKNTSTAILNLFMGTPDELWLGTWGLGLAKLTISKGSWEFAIPDQKEYLKKNVYSNIVNEVIQKSENELWVCSQDQGLLIFNKNENRFDKIKSDPTDPFSILSDNINGIYEDHEHRFWIFNIEKGVSLLDPINQYFHFYDLQQENICLQNDATVFDFAFNESTKKFYVTTIGCEKLFVFDQHKKLIQSIALNPKFVTSQEGYHVLIGNDQSIYLAGGNKNDDTYSFLKYNTITNTLVPFSPIDLNGFPINSYKYTGIIEDENKHIWLSTHLGGLIKFDVKNNRIKQYVDDKSTPHTIDILTEINEIKLAENGIIWIATLQEGVFSFNPKTEQFKHYPSFDDSKKGLRGNRIITLEEDQHGKIWVGLSSTGIQIIDPEKENWLAGSFQSKDGLPNEQIWKIVRDQQGNIWLATQYGLCRFDEKNKSFIQYTIVDGIKQPALIGKGIYVASNGEMLFGQTNGFGSFFPSQLYQNNAPSKLAFTSFQVLNRDMNLDKNLNFLEKINLKHNENFFTIGFAALNFTNARKNKYAFKLEGYDADWKYNDGNRNLANYTKVPPGNYTFFVKAANRENFWSEQPISIKIIVKPPFWKTWWAYLCYLILSLAALRWINQFQLKRKLAQQEADYFKKLNDAKTKLFNNITHELRTPLTVVLGNVNRAERLNRSLTNYELKMIKDNGEHLLKLMNQVLDMGKLDAGAMPIDYAWDDIVGFIKYVTNSFETLADEKRITLIFEAHPSVCQAYFDKEKLSIIISNLLSNALKFTGEGGLINILLKIKEPAIKNNQEKNPQRTLELKVKDTGIGIAERQVPFIFDRFFQAGNLNESEDFSKTQPKGTGIGLSLSKELILLMGGNISVKSKVNKGSIFRIELPILSRPEISFPTDVSKKENLPIVLLVEDNPSLVQYISHSLSPHFQLAIENNGKSGLEKATELIPDIIVSDIVMPQMDGITLCKKIKNDNRTSHIPVILLTAKVGKDSKILGLKSGADAYLAKPFDEQELLIRIHNLITQRINLREFYLNQSGLVEFPKSYSLELSNEAQKKENEFLEKVTSLLENQLDNPNFNIEFLSKSVGLSHTQLNRKLVALIGKPPIKLMRAIKMKKAKELLLSTTLTISEVAYKTGFTDPSYFSKIFKSEVGSSPKQFRQKMN